MDSMPGSWHPRSFSEVRVCSHRLLVNESVSTRAAPSTSAIGAASANSRHERHGFETPRTPPVMAIAATINPAAASVGSSISRIAEPEHLPEHE